MKDQDNLGLLYHTRLFLTTLQGLGQLNRLLTTGQWMKAEEYLFGVHLQYCTEINRLKQQTKELK